MSLERIKKLQLKYESNKREGKPDFDKMNEAELDRYIQMMFSESHKVNGIFTYEQALEKLNWQLSQNLMSKEEYDIIVQGEKYFWNPESK